jgi:hypothetical protein
MKIERRSTLSRQEFLDDYISRDRPVIVTDAMDGWPAKTLWNEAYLASQVGHLDALVYNELFDLTGIQRLGDYLQRNFGSNIDGRTEYVRWYSRQKPLDFVWADEAFKLLKKDWCHPYFFPVNGYIAPYAQDNCTGDVTESLYPYRGLFISGAGARTRLHRDPWTTSAVLCQFSGSKSVVMYSPDQADCLMDRTDFVDIHKPDLARFPRLKEAHVNYRDVIQPGEVLFIPSGWFHDVVSVSNSISVTWNFIHEVHTDRFLSYVKANPNDGEMDVLRFFTQSQ